jgi:hypothetical protein
MGLQSTYFSFLLSSMAAGLQRVAQGFLKATSSGIVPKPTWYCSRANLLCFGGGCSDWSYLLQELLLLEGILDVKNDNDDILWVSKNGSDSLGAGL